MASEIRVNKINSRTGVGTITLSPTGVDFTGIATVATLKATTGIVTTLSVTGTTTLNGNLDLQDNDKILIGTGDDLEIYHDGSNSRIKNTTGQLWLQSDNGIRFVDSDVNESTAAFYDNGAVELYYDGSKKFETKSDGIVVTGGIYLDGSGGTGSANKLGDYEQGTWTPTASGTWSGFANSTITNSSATYTKIGRAVHIQTNITFPDSTGNLTVGDYVKLDGLPFNYGGSGDNIYNSIPSQVFVRDSTNGGVSHGYLISSNEVQVRVVAVYGSGARSQTGLKLSFTYFTD